MLKKLDLVFQQKLDVNKMLLLGKFPLSKMDTNETAVEYIATVENLAHRIKNSGENINEITLITKILGTLQLKYHNSRQIWLSMNDCKQNLSNLAAKLIKEETNLNENDLDKSAFVTNYRISRSPASYNKRKMNQTKAKLDKSKITCFCCRKKGHFVTECRS